MATVKIVKPKERAAALNEATKDGKAQSLSSGINIPTGKHSFIVADKDAFGFLFVTSNKGGVSKDWVLPIVAGSMETEDGQTIEFEISDKPGAKTLVIPDALYLKMQLNGDYTITVDNRNGRNVVTNVEALVLAEA